MKPKHPLALLLAALLLAALACPAQAGISFSIGFGWHSGRPAIVVPPGHFHRGPFHRVVPPPPFWYGRGLHRPWHGPVFVRPHCPSRIVVPPPPPPAELVIWITNSNGSQVAVKLQRRGPGWVGPRGEYYARRPSQEQLRVVYGF